MADVMKHDRDTAQKILRHGGRMNKTYRNPDIDPKLTKHNKSFIYDDDGNDISFDLYRKRLDEVYVYNRKDVKTLCGWIVTLPREFKGMDMREANSIMWHVHNYLCSRYGKENAVQSVVHHDESGMPHLHFYFIPVVPDPKRHKESGLKVCADKVINRKELQVFHSDLRDYLNKHVSYPKNIGNYFYTGVTKSQGGNKTVDQLKHERELQRTIERLQIDNNRLQTENARLQDRVHELEEVIDKAHGANAEEYGMDYEMGI